MTDSIYHVLLVASKHHLKCLVSVVIEFLMAYEYAKPAPLHNYAPLF